MYFIEPQYSLQKSKTISLQNKEGSIEHGYLEHFVEWWKCLRAQSVKCARAGAGNELWLELQSRLKDVNGNIQREHPSKQDSHDPELDERAARRLTHDLSDLVWLEWLRCWTFP